WGVLCDVHNPVTKQEQWGRTIAAMSTAGTSPTSACVLLRVWLPDRPGALGAVASRIGAVRGDIVGIDVLERNDGVAIDEFGVVLSDAELLPLLVREVEEVDGCRIEHVTVVS